MSKPYDSKNSRENPIVTKNSLTLYEGKVSERFSDVNGTLSDTVGVILEHEEELSEIKETLTNSGGVANKQDLEEIKNQLGNKVDKEGTKGLSQNDFTNAYKDQIDTNTDAIKNLKSIVDETNPEVEGLAERLTAVENGKVDKVSGKELVSTSDITQISTNKSNISSLTSALGDKVDKVSGKDLVSTSDITQITTNKDNISSLTSTVGNKVDKVSGKELVSTSDITQITTNKNNITNLTTTVGNKVDKVSGKDLVSSSDITQITTNKNNIATIQNTLDGVASYLEGRI